jgi:hypothetical protein
MKITIDIDCTPEEARSFLGLPPVQAMQEALVAQLQERLSQSLASADPESLIKLWWPEGVQGLAKLQEGFFRQWMAGAGGARSAASEDQGKDR